MQSKFLQTVEGTMQSFGWKSILNGKELLLKGLKKKLGNGKSFNLWIDKWIADIIMRAPLIKNIMIDINLKENDIIEVRTRGWNIERLYDLFYQSDIDLIMEMKPIVSRNDFWIRSFNRSGEYSVKSEYWLAHKEKNA